MSSPRALRLDVRPSAEDAIVRLPEAEQAAALAAVRAIPAAFGRQLRAVFIRAGDTLKVQLIGDHHDVRRYLRSF